MRVGRFVGRFEVRVYILVSPVGRGARVLMF